MQLHVVVVDVDVDVVDVVVVVPQFEMCKIVQMINTGYNKKKKYIHDDCTIFDIGV